jgi:hypothetical protein
MNLRSFVSATIHEICDGAKDAGCSPPRSVEMEIAMTKEGGICRYIGEAVGRSKFTVNIATCPNDKSSATDPAAGVERKEDSR